MITSPTKGERDTISEDEDYELFIKKAGSEITLPLLIINLEEKRST